MQRCTAKRRKPFGGNLASAANFSAYAEARFLQGLRPNRPEPYVLQAQILASLKETERAEVALAKAQEIAPRNAFVHLRMALTRMDRKDVAGAEAALDEAQHLDPSSKFLTRRGNPQMPQNATPRLGRFHRVLRWLGRKRRWCLRNSAMLLGRKPLPRRILNLFPRTRSLRAKTFDARI